MCQNRLLSWLWSPLLLLSAGGHDGVVLGRASSTGCPAKLPITEDERLREFNRIHKEWPPPVRYPGGHPQQDTAEWLRYMQRKENEVMAITDSTWRWERWLELAQIVLLRNFTENGWGIGHVPAELHKKIRKDFRKNHKEQKRSEGHVAGYITGKRSMVQVSHRQELMDAVQKAVGEWAGIEPHLLEPTSMYGIRTYYQNSTLETHVDVVASHILSAVYVVDDKYENSSGTMEPWYMVADPDLSGELTRVHVKPGELFFYESAKLPHGRPTVFHGKYSSHCFVHFRPKGWNFTNEDRVYALPGHWASGRGGTAEL